MAVVVDGRQLHAVLQQGVEAPPDLLVAHLFDRNLGDAYRRGRSHLAADAYGQALRLDPAQPLALEGMDLLRSDTFDPYLLLMDETGEEPIGLATDDDSRFAGRDVTPT